MEEEKQLTFNIVVPLYKKLDIVDKFSIKRLFDVIDTKYDVYFIFDTNYKYFNELELWLSDELNLILNKDYYINEIEGNWFESKQTYSNSLKYL